MKAGSDVKSHETPVRYRECDWGDLIEGTKEQLQGLGIGIGRAFPGDPGGPCRGLTTQDQRGFRARIRWNRNENRFTCWLEFPDWPKQPHELDQWSPAAPGVKTRESFWFDEYVGSADDLAAAGLVRLDQLPGQPGMRKVRVTVLQDGSLPTGAPTAKCRGAGMPGAKTIERASAASYRVRILVPEEEGKRRAAARRAAEDAWRQQVSALPRPARLHPLPAGRAATAPALPPLFGDAPTAALEKQVYQKRVFDSLRDLVDFTQTSAY